MIKSRIVQKFRPFFVWATRGRSNARLRIDEEKNLDMFRLRVFAQLLMLTLKYGRPGDKHFAANAFSPGVAMFFEDAMQLFPKHPRKSFLLALNCSTEVPGTHGCCTATANRAIHTFCAPFNTDLHASTELFDPKIRSNSGKHAPMSPVRIAVAVRARGTSSDRRGGPELLRYAYVDSRFVPDGPEHVPIRVGPLRITRSHQDNP